MLDICLYKLILKFRSRTDKVIDIKPFKMKIAVFSMVQIYEKITPVIKEKNASGENTSPAVK